MKGEGVEEADPRTFLAALRAAGIQRVAGVPCSSMTGLIDCAMTSRDLPYVNAPNEGEALAYAAGVWLGGGAAAVLCQNSGLGNLANALTSLIAPYRIPSLLLIGWRGHPEEKDEPQHRLMGGLTEGWLVDCGVETETARAEDASEKAREAARDVADKGRLRALLIPPGLFAPALTKARREAGRTKASSSVIRSRRSGRIARRDAIEAIMSSLPPDALAVASTGYIGRELLAFDPAPTRFAMSGSMGHLAALACGLAETVFPRPVVALDGDGAILMRLSALPMVGGQGPANLLHVVLDNGTHESTGGQPTLSCGVDLCQIAALCGYRQIAECGAAGEIESAVAAALKDAAGPNFLRVAMTPKSAPIPPRVAVPPEDMATRFRDVARVMR